LTIFLLCVLLDPLMAVVLFECSVFLSCSGRQKASRGGGITLDCAFFADNGRFGLLENDVMMDDG